MTEAERQHLIADLKYRIWASRINLEGLDLQQKRIEAEYRQKLDRLEQQRRNLPKERADAEAQLAAVENSAPDNPQ